MHFFQKSRWLLPAALLLNVAPALSQITPVETAAARPALAYQSAFESYRKFDDQPVGSWSDINNTVRSIGGWRTYAKEAGQPAPVDGGGMAVQSPSSVAPALTVAPAAPTPTASPAAPAAPSGAHQGHGGKR